MEDLSVYFDSDFAQAATLAGVPVRGILSTEAVETPEGHLTTEPGFELQAGSYAVGATLVVGASSYRVRRVEPQPPDGATVRLALAQA